MKKLLISLLAMLLVAGSAYALNESADNGPQDNRTVYVTDMGDLTSGDSVVLQSYANATYPGREVTGTTTKGLSPYGIVLGDPTRATCANGGWITVRKIGYVECNVVYPDDRGAGSIAVNQELVTAGGSASRCYHNKLMPGNTGVSGSSVFSLDTINGIPESAVNTHPVGTRVRAFMNY